MQLKRTLVAPSNAVGLRLPSFVHQHQAGHLGAYDYPFVRDGGNRKLANELLDLVHDGVRIELNSERIRRADWLGERHTPNLLQRRGVKIQNRSLNKGCTNINAYESQHELLRLAG